MDPAQDIDRRPQLEALIAYEDTFDGLYGLEITECSEEIVRGRVQVRESVKQVMGLVHGGVYASMAESMASFGTAAAVAAEGKVAVGLSNQTSFVRPITEGQIHAVARRRHSGRTTWIWDVEISDDAGRTCALSRMTIAVREPRS
jgi:uncharacterized protein (TIGR00369 family)